MKFKNYLDESKVFNMNTYKNIENKLKDQWKRVTKGKGASAKYGSWILEVYNTEKDFLNAPIEVSDQINNKFKDYKNLKQAVADFPDLDKFMFGMRGKNNSIRFERSR